MAYCTLAEVKADIDLEDASGGYSFEFDL